MSIKVLLWITLASYYQEPGYEARITCELRIALHALYSGLCLAALEKNLMFSLKLHTFESTKLLVPTTLKAARQRPEQKTFMSLIVDNLGEVRTLMLKMRYIFSTKSLEKLEVDLTQGGSP